MDTDQAWELWGSRDPYFGVLTDPKFRAGVLTPHAIDEFFSLGAMHVDHVLGVCRRHFDAAFEPRRVLDFGCGVGRLLVPFSHLGASVVGMDISPSMLAEAARNCVARGASNVTFVRSDDALSAAVGRFDLVHSCIVLQHIAVPRGRALFAALVDKVQPGGCGALHITFGWDFYRSSLGVQPPPVVPDPTMRSLVKRRLREWAQSTGLLPVRSATMAPADANADPDMQMNFYNMSELMFILQQSGIQRSVLEYTDHGGALGAFIFFRRDAEAPAA